MAEPNLPEQGSYPEPWHGELGVLLEKDGRVQCHVCGQWFVELGRHASTKHKLPAEVYRSYFGLAIRRPLCPEWLSEQRSAKAKGERFGHGRTSNVELTSEQRSLIAYRRESRVETAKKRQQQLPGQARDAANARWAKERAQSEKPRVQLRRHPT